jgi:hypothetical protein
VALLLAPFRVDTPMLSGGNPKTSNGWVHGIAFLLIIATGWLRRWPWLSRCGVTQAGDPSRSFLSRRVRSLLFPVLALGNASFLMAIVTVFAWIAAVAVRLATHQQSQQDQQAT